MTFSLTDFLTFLGSIGLFLYGIKSVSDGLQKLAGDHLRGIISDIKENKFRAVFSGLCSTALVQSSSATTVIAVSSVNAGLISLAQAIAVIMGANVGTTFTTWLVSVLGISLDLHVFFLPMVAIGLPLYNSDNRKFSSIGELLIGLGLLFFSILILDRTMPDTIGTLSSLSSIWLVLTGIPLTMIVQASSVSFTLAVLLCLHGTFTVEQSCALVLGANIGTCINPLLASLKANVMARRTALSHLLFNLFGVIWAFAFLSPICSFIDTGHKEIDIAIFHSSFNLVNLMIFIWFTDYFEQLVTKIINDNSYNKSDNSFKLQLISSGLIDSGEISLSQAKQEAVNYSKETYKMFSLITTMVSLPNGSAKLHSICDKVMFLKTESEKAEEEIALFLRDISTSTLSTDGDQLSMSIFRMIDEMGSIADSTRQLALTLKRRSDLCIVFNDKLTCSLKQMIMLTDMSLRHMVASVEKEEATEALINKAYNIEDEINNFRNMLRKSTIEMIDRKEIEFLHGTLFMELINQCEKIGDFVVNVLSSLPRE